MDYIIIRYSSSSELYHHGILGMKWGIRRTPAQLGHRTPTPRKTADGKIGTYNTKGHVTKSDYGVDKSKLAKSNNTSQYKNGEKALSNPFTNAKNFVAKKYDEIKRIDKILDTNVEFARIQVEKDVTPYAFYATYKKHDVDEYAGLYGASLRRRADKAAKEAEKEAKLNKDDEDLKSKAEELRNVADNMNVYQVKFGASKSLKVPSDRNAEDIVADLYKDNSFRNDFRSVIQDTRTRSNMQRPKQKALMSEAEKIMSKHGSELSRKERATLYKALNLSLTFHDKDYFNSTSDKFYSALKKKGYSAIVDINDQKYSSFHAKKPMIIFDTDSVSVKSIKELDQHYMDKMYKKYNRERIIKEVPTQIMTALPNYGKTALNDAYTYNYNKIQDYLDTGGA